MLLPKEVQECLEKMLSVLTLKEANSVLGYLNSDSEGKAAFDNENPAEYANFMEALETELVWQVQREAMEEDWENTEWVSSDRLTSEEVAIDNENYLLDLEGK